MTLAQETTTLPEGVTLTLMRDSNPKTGTVSTTLYAAREKAEVKMKVDNVAPGCLRTYLDLVVRTIRQERGQLTAKPDIPASAPNTFKDFTRNMAHSGMFVFDALTNADATTDSRIPPTGRKVSRKARRKSDKSPTG